MGLRCGIGNSQDPPQLGRFCSLKAALLGLGPHGGAGTTELTARGKSGLLYAAISYESAKTYAG